jgi:hypothetical protein
VPLACTSRENFGWVLTTASSFKTEPHACRYDEVAMRAPMETVTRRIPEGTSRSGQEYVWNPKIGALHAERQFPLLPLAGVNVKF